MKVMRAMKVMRGEGACEMHAMYSTVLRHRYHRLHSPSWALQGREGGTGDGGKANWVNCSVWPKFVLHTMISLCSGRACRACSHVSGTSQEQVGSRGLALSTAEAPIVS